MGLGQPEAEDGSSSPLGNELKLAAQAANLLPALAVLAEMALDGALLGGMIYAASSAVMGRQMTARGLAGTFVGSAVGGIVPASGLASFMLGGVLSGVAARAVEGTEQTWGAALLDAGLSAALFGAGRLAPAIFRRLRGCNCFPEETEVWTERGTIAIENVEAGDRVACANPAGGEWTWCEVEAPYEREYEGDLVGVVVGGMRLEATGPHPFWGDRGEDLDRRAAVGELPAAGKVEGATGRWGNARDLRTGGVLRLASGEDARVESVAPWSGTLRVRNLVVRGQHEYAVGFDGVLVHNCPAGYGPGGTEPSNIGPAAEIDRVSALGSQYGLAGRAALAEAVAQTTSLSQAKELVRTHRTLTKLVARAEAIFDRWGVLLLPVNKSYLLQSRSLRTRSLARSVIASWNVWLTALWVGAASLPIFGGPGRGRRASMLVWASERPGT